MSAQIETRLARMALKLPKLKPLQAQKLEIILDRIYRVHLSRKLKQRGGTRPSTDEEIAELERQKAADDEVWAELEAELEKDVAAQEAAEAIDAEPISEAEEEEEAAETEDESAFENIMDEVGEFEIIKRCSECDNCVPITIPEKSLRTPAEIKGYWDALNKANNECAKCLHCLKTCRSPEECSEKEQKTEITKHNLTKRQEGFTQRELEYLTKDIKAVKKTIKKIKPCPECAECIPIEEPPKQALLYMDKAKLNSYYQDLIKYKDLLLLTQNKCTICSQCCQPQECPDIGNTMANNTKKVLKTNVLLNRVIEQRKALTRRQMLAGRRRK